MKYRIDIDEGVVALPPIVRHMKQQIFNNIGSA